MQILDIETFPWHGQRLIEASAGTGKTYTIAGLYNRLILGHKHPALDCDKILVVTFTKAATEELRGRLRARIQDSLQGLLKLKNQLNDDKDQDLRKLASYLAANSPEQNEQTLTRLKYNLALMDEASIYTIHGFCQRMLQRFAFDTGAMFSAQLSIDVQDVLQQACEDVWRNKVYGLDRARSEWILNSYQSPDEVLNKIRARFDKKDLKILPEIHARSLSDVWGEYEQAFIKARALCENYHEEDLRAVIEQSGLNKRSYTKTAITKIVTAFFAYFNAPLSFEIPKDVLKLRKSFMQEKLEKGELPEHPLLAAVEALCEAQDNANNYLRLGWFEEIQAHFFELLNRSGTITTDDLMRLLQQALLSPQGANLAAQIRTLYPVAMIDEFQDTDSLQYAIFNAIYPEGAAEKTHSLIMIGDPKQAIYAFRGADIFTYMKAKRALPESSCFTLDTNYRSHSDLIAGVNALFEQKTNPFMYKGIDFEPVKADGKKDPKFFNFAGVKQTPLQVFFHEKAKNNDASKKSASEQCAQKIAQLLQGDANLGTQPVQACDIAVLVKDRNQAARIRDDLLALGVFSVYLNKESVFASIDAKELYQWLDAVAHPSDERKLRMALTSSLYDHSAEHLAMLLVDETQWENAIATNQHYHDIWHKSGIMAALMQWLENDDLASRIRCQPNGERRLTNLLHLGDLLQSTSRKLQGQEALLRYFAKQVYGEEAANEEVQLRLESDANLVSIVTIHSSKGLQYPLVFLPFLWSDSCDEHRNEDCLYFDEMLQKLVLHLKPSETEKMRARMAREAEQTRLLYVALTRAEQGCFVWLMNNTSHNKTVADKSALGLLLQVQIIGDELNCAELQTRFADSPFYFGAEPEWKIAARAQASAPSEAISAQQVKVREYDPWRVSSYSALTTKENLEQEFPAQLKTDEGQAQKTEVFSTQEEQEKIENVFDATAFALNFIKGAQAGSTLHDVLEHWDFQDEKQLAALCEQKLNYYALPIEEAQRPQLLAWFQAMVATPLQDNFGNSFALSDLNKPQRLSEMEFHLPVPALLKPPTLMALLGTDTHLDFSPMTGFLKGFIDLIFVHNDRYYVADYKSNFLGFEVQDYLGKSLTKAMQEHLYDLQAWIYTLALDALLCVRLGENYQPERHLGGAYYFFLRGMHLGAQAPRFMHNGLEQAPGVFYLPPDVAKLQQWRVAFFDKEQAL